LAEYDAIINLSGENIGGQRWSKQRKQAILKSRTNCTQKIVEALLQLEKPPFLINASAVGIYPTAYNASSPKQCEEDDAVTSAENFLNQVGLAWEAALKPLERAHIPYAVTRFGVVLEKNGGMVREVLPSFKFMMGSVLGSGQQSFSWVHRDDVISAMAFLLQKRLAGVFNVVAPEVVTQRQFAKTLARVMHRPCFMRLPAFVIKLLFGQMGQELLLSGQSVSSKKLQDAGFSFQYPKLEKALKDIVSK